MCIPIVIKKHLRFFTYSRASNIIQYSAVCGGIAQSRHRNDLLLNFLCSHAHINYERILKAIDSARSRQVGNAHESR